VTTGWNEQSPAGQAFAARGVLRAAKWACLATCRHDDAGAPQPFASLVTPAVTADGAVLMLLSSLAEHSRHLVANPSCALMAVGQPENLNWQTAPRVTVEGTAQIVADRQARQYWLARHPYARLYAEFTDFSLWRLIPVQAVFVGGFGQAARLTGEELMPGADAVASVAAAANALVAHCNAAHGEALNRLAHARGAQGAWRMLGVDTDGVDLAQDETVLRLAFDVPVCDEAEALAALQRLTAAAAQRFW
jgi:putative heme iron utilization protein